MLFWKSSDSFEQEIEVSWGVAFDPMAYPTHIVRASVLAHVEADSDIEPVIESGVVERVSVRFKATGQQARYAGPSTRPSRTSPSNVTRSESWSSVSP